MTSRLLGQTTEGGRARDWQEATCRAQPRTSGWEWPGETAGELAWLSDIKTPGWVQTRRTTTTRQCSHLQYKTACSGLPGRPISTCLKGTTSVPGARGPTADWRKLLVNYQPRSMSNCKMQNPLILNIGTMTSRQTSYGAIPEKQHSRCMIYSQHCDYFLSSNEKGILFKSIIREKVLCNIHLKAVAYISEEMMWDIFIFEPSK